VVEKFIKVVKAFSKAKAVNHYYWVHTDGDDAANRSVSIENIAKIIGLMTQIEISRKEVDIESEFHRAFVERTDSGKKANIYVVASEPSFWRRFATVKELCHLLIDEDEDFQPDPQVTLRHMKDGSSLFDENSTPENDSENLAEIIAMELVYPLEHRREDRNLMASGTSLVEIAKSRDVPRRYVSLGTSDNWFSLCERIWKSLADVDPPNLNHLLSN
jgi:Zn-dependent peptidase ImmA (M78 family)